MPATPAWPPRSAPRLYVEADLGAGAAVPVDGNAAHYLISVMRVKDGDAALLFNGRDGEWAARCTAIRKRGLVLECVEQTKPLETVPDFWLCSAPIKKGRIDLVMEKATELGVARIVPVLMARCVVDKLNPERLAAQMIEAAEQCGRTALPELGETVKLDALLKDWPIGRMLFFADELGGAPIRKAFAAAQPDGGHDALKFVMSNAEGMAKGGRREAQAASSPAKTKKSTTLSFTTKSRRKFLLALI